MTTAILGWVYNISILIWFILVTYVYWWRYPFICLVSKMADEWWAMYDGFYDTGKHSTKWVWITKEFLKLAFACGHHEESYLCSRCETCRSKMGRHKYHTLSQNETSRSDSWVVTNITLCHPLRGCPKRDNFGPSHLTCMTHVRHVGPKWVTHRFRYTTYVTVNTSYKY
jgi:hypothetical protein